ncbi:transcriptional regulator, IclR family [Beutenbergia cavernae DSM 12333]|uniref:Transcriptional regulator, IclR family n=1 Tax=Beutenbergia cavernae (strain ATCC BAA-8 / DSM 12333 / CCUG 43141 / JCM 11478 / NBRC 16432 / NCIMB 13614 / HKI 0122) TaxID=471853 RepID=C5BYW5_BEUC1|nr:helix-turn-helix domain-containing protein [Beutenbergia cavernae]ACQ81080.1 transcriptional regulator, IclR family [Beutenbergia cavernae DSM 12333]
MTVPQLPGATRNQALARGLHVLQMVVDEDAPLTGTEVARRLGVHQSSASRILATLTEIGYLRKNDAGAFAPDYGVFALASAATRVSLLRTARGPIEAFAADHPDFMLAMSMLWRDELIYLLRVRHGTETVTFWSGHFPFNVSVLALKLVLDLPEEEALEILRASRRRDGWGGDPAVVADTEEGVLAAARELLADDVLILENWLAPHHIAGAIDLVTPEPHPVALALVDVTGSVGPDKLKVLLHQARRAVEQSF